jgi:hypothetical protein
MKPLRQFVIGLAILGAVIWVMAKLMPAPMTADEMREQAQQRKIPPSPAEQQRQLKEELKKALKFQYEWTTGGFGSVMMANITITNPTLHSVKDMEIRCSTFGASGTKLGDLRQTIYELVKPKSTKKVRQVNMGFIHSQTKTVGCIISDLVVLPP